MKQLFSLRKLEMRPGSNRISSCQCAQLMEYVNGQQWFHLQIIMCFGRGHYLIHFDLGTDHFVSQSFRILLCNDGPAMD